MLEIVDNRGKHQRGCALVTPRKNNEESHEEGWGTALEQNTDCSVSTPSRNETVSRPRERL